MKKIHPVIKKLTPSKEGSCGLCEDEKPLIFRDIEMKINFCQDCFPCVLGVDVLLQNKEYQLSRPEVINPNH